MENSDGAIIYRPAFVPLTGSVEAALMLSHAIELSRRAEDWFCLTQDEWLAATGLTRRQQETARGLLRAHSWWSEQRIGLPSRLHYHVDVDALAAVMRSIESQL